MSAFPRYVHFVGIGGAGMAPLAELLKLRFPELVISGSDLLLNDKTRQLEKLGIRVFAGHRADQLPLETGLVIYSSAAGTDNPERQAAAAAQIPQLRRGEALARLAATFRRTVAVSGSHGKSSITGCLAHILKECGKCPGFMIGAKCRGDLPSAALGNGDVFITEVDESDGTHTAIFPDLGIVPNVDADHEWSVGGAAALAENFRTFAGNCHRLLYYDSAATAALFAGLPQAEALPLPPEDYSFAGRWGFEAINAQMAVTAAVMMGCGRAEAMAAAADFPGVERRMTPRLDTAALTVIEDYAHHPTELHHALNLLRHNYGNHHLRVLFQPHRYARLEKFFPDFVRELRRADSCFILPVFAAWTESGQVDSRRLAADVGAEYCSNIDQKLAERLAAPASDGRPLLVAVIGAGDLDAVLPELLSIGGELPAQKAKRS